MPPATPDEIATAALDHWEHKLPSHKGKPRASDEWTVYAAIVATRTTTLTNNNDNDTDNKITVVSCATGTKCTAVPPVNRITSTAAAASTTSATTTTTTTLPPTADVILHDSHAEVLARRGLLRVLWQEIAMHDGRNSDIGNEGTRSSLLTKIPNSHRYQLRENVQLHLFVSDSPCGDASIYPLDTLSASSGSMKSDDKSSLPSDAVPSASTEYDNHNNNNGLQFTGAKVIVSQETTVSIEDCGGIEAFLLQDSRVARERIQLLGRLRTKSGRSNLQANQRSDSLSCSDKIVRWCVLGLQGRALLHHLVEPIRLSSIVVSRDIRNQYGGNGNTGAQWEALYRAIPNRIMAVKEELLREDVSNMDGNGMQAPNRNMVNADAIDIPKVYIAKPMFAQGKACSEHANNMASRKRKHDENKNFVKPKLSPTGVCLNWNMWDDTVELTIGARGIRQGKKPKTERDILKLASRLSRYDIWKISCSISSAETYLVAKSTETRQNSWRSVIFRRGPLAGWMVSGVQDLSTVEKETAAPQSNEI